ETATRGASRRAFRFSSFSQPGTMVLRAEGSGRMLPKSSPLAAPPDGQRLETGGADGLTWMKVRSTPGGVVAAASEFRSVKRGLSRLERVSVYVSGPRRCPRVETAVRSLAEVEAKGFDGLLAAHRANWARRWAGADIRIDGDPELEHAIRFALFHLIASVASGGEAAVGARGLSGRAYRGHVFWDSDVYVLPFLVATHPPAARATLEYRLRRLPEALRAAREHGRQGARFPWESAWSGREVTPRALRGRGGEVVPVLTGEREEHIVADIAWAAACYIDWTADAHFATGPGLELLVQTARWWASRIDTDPAGQGHIRGVIGPDEYHERVDDNAYTNVMARWNLRRAADAGTGIVDKPERHHWLELADAIVDGYDPGTRIYEQFAGFNSLEPLLIADVAPRRPVNADMLLGPARVHRAQVVKQADALMLHYLVPEETDPDSLEPNLDFYEPRTAHGSTLSPGVHAALFARAGRSKQALEMLRLTARIDLDDVGNTSAGGLHLAAMGSVWR